MDRPKLLDGRLKIRHLVLIDALSRCGSVVRAATELRVTQPVATRSLREIETILGVELYTRGPRGISPTQYGAAFTDHARAVLAQLNQASRHILELADADRGTVTVGTHLAGSNILLPQAIAELKRSRPLLTVVVREGTPEALLTEIQAGRIDMVVGRLTAPSTTEVTRLPLYEEGVEVFTGVEHPLAQIKEPSLAKVAQYPWILPGPETNLRRELEVCFAQADVPMPIDRVEATNYLTVRELLRHTHMVAVLPGLIGRADAHLVAVPVDLGQIGHSVGLTVAAGRPLSPAATALVESMRWVAGHRLQNEAQRRFHPQPEVGL